MVQDGRGTLAAGLAVRMRDRPDRPTHFRLAFAGVGARMKVRVQCLAGFRARGRRPPGHRWLRLAECIMVHGEFRILVATLATFVSLFGVALAIHGLFFDRNDLVLYGAATIGGAIFAFVLMLTLHPKDIEVERHRET
jgi:hypothetical protein